MRHRHVRGKRNKEMLANVRKERRKYRAPGPNDGPPRLLFPRRWGGRLVVLYIIISKKCRKKKLTRGSRRAVSSPVVGRRHHRRVGGHMVVSG
jgi:hypothetical protein